ncbi:hypothetical protein SAMN02910265_01610 [Ruminococcus flavefaciens]|uniref:Uncharacterized protein n=1 Tax=Ruminococcus flavefaciens TaxID=1265 RepID=A0A1H6JBZ8_RUMFL|nr:hypothetical protein [Ruminococcus flavefaciens]SEH59644.1 hypothetical protein SAMN02910265_01610 [Ruminococcus flavefaciens]
MKPIEIIKKIPTGGPAGEILKIIALFTATVLLDKVGEILEDSLNQKNTQSIDVKFEEVG